MAVARDGDAVVRLSGVLCADTSESVRARLIGLLHDADCVVVDLDGVEIAHPAVLGVLASALHDAGGWPVAKLAVLASRPEVRRALAEAEVDRFVVIIPATDDAREACDRRPPEVRATWTLPAVDTSPGQARWLLGDRLRLWGCRAGFVADAVQLVNELVTNAVEHAGTEARVAVHLEDGVLVCSVRDHSAVPPVPRRPGEGRGGFGLLLVDAIAQGWGWIPHPDGKTVWAVTGPPDEPPGPEPRAPVPPLPWVP
jgi:anti-anti-sigma regulatory factor/anti-sigma regulatory factor (Ser/Thr protein kinase)